ncbi:kinase-like domain-containing protein [Aspergillus multicolor]|uniref:kinase-like domain-containing protein n=1 Tax=Aspergillus multicolor TaxID=41759 RepID=UPI003CCDEF78
MARFEKIIEDVEPIEEYRPGGYHPVHLGDVIKNTYKIIGKLGYGRFSTVWLAEDLDFPALHPRCLVALRILKADLTINNTELMTYTAPQFHVDESEHLLKLLYYFHVFGASGAHLCLVFPVMLGDCQGMVANRPKDVQYIAKQILLGPHSLHTAMEADLQPTNIMVTTKQTPGYAGTEAYPRLLFDPERVPIKGLEGVQAIDSVPKYLVPSQRQRGRDQGNGVDISSLLFKIGNLEAAMPILLGNNSYSPPNRVRPGTLPAMPTALRAPELIEPSRWNAAIDAWALGCLHKIFELATSKPLFTLTGKYGPCEEDMDYEHEMLIELVVGRGLDWFITHLTRRLPADFGEKSTRDLAGFLLCMLKEKPAERMTTTELLRHRYLYVEIED